MSKTQVGRLALRVEGDWWNAYYALEQTSMEGALLLGSVRFGAAQNPKVKKAFMDMMREVVGIIIQDALGQTPTWGGPVPAPERERSGSA